MKRILLLIALIILAGVRGGAAQDTTTAVSPALQAQLDDMEATTRQIRQLDGDTVAREFPTRSETMDFVTTSLNVQLPADEADHYLRFYTAFDLLPPDTDLRAVYTRLLGAQVAGFYDSDTRIMHVVPIDKPITDSLSLVEQITYVHEYTHALQDQNFDLDRLLNSADGSDNPDRSLATLALVEGDATHVMVFYLQQLIQESPMAALQLLGESVQAGGLAMPAGTPPILERELLFPYITGLSFVQTLQMRGGWEAVDQAFERPPVASAHVLHPEQYLAGMAPVAVTLGDSAATLGDGWRSEWDSTLGEWYLGEYLRTQIPQRQAASAANGWNGDRFHLYVNDATGAQAWVLKLAWTNADEAAEFAQDYADFGNRRFTNQLARAAQQDGCWTNETETLCVQALAQETRIAQAPERAQAQALLDAQTG